jgi:pyruvate ferredoxin oxidoreductase gamma subunit
MSITEIRTHGRGGQGAVTAMEILAKAAGLDGRYVQAFPSFGVERRGAPVKAFCRISDHPITIRSQVYEPNYVIILDPSLSGLAEVTEGLKENSVIVLNSNGKDKDRAKFIQKSHAYDATSLAIDVLGKDIVNTAMLGVFAKVTGSVSLESLLKILEEKFSGRLAELNTELVKRAYDEADGGE